MRPSRAEREGCSKAGQVGEGASGAPVAARAGVRHCAGRPVLGQLSLSAVFAVARWRAAQPLGQADRTVGVSCTCSRCSSAQVVSSSTYGAVRRMSKSKQPRSERLTLSRS